MKIKLITFASLMIFFGSFYFSFAQDNNSARWNIDPRTYIGLNPEGVYIELPQGDNLNYSNEPAYNITPQGIFAVGPNFRVHPRTIGTQSETPITRHPLNPNIFFASANTYQGGNFSTGVYVTTNGGVTWTGNDTLNGNMFNWGDPGPVIDKNGRFLISYITTAYSMGASFSINNGVNWAPTVTFPGATTSADKNFSATDDAPTSIYYGRSYTVFTEFAGSNVNRIVRSYTTNGGLSWSTVAAVSPPPSSGHHHQGCDLRVGSNGTVYVVWANCTTNGQNSTEDSLGFAKSTNGGVTWTAATNRAVNMNGIRSQNLFNNIRANGFPRIDVDRTCGVYTFPGYIYVVTAEKNFAPAKGVADIVLIRSTDGGTSWTRTKVNQNTDSTKYDFTPAVRVDESGAVNICYYSTRNIPTNDSAQIYLSRSTNGGATFTDVLISDHKFKPAPISGTATNYQGDYIGITSGGAGKIFPYWCEGSTASGGRYQAWTALVDVSMNYMCENFTCINFPPSTMYQSYSGTSYWSRHDSSANDVDSGSAKFNFFTAPAGTVQSLYTFIFSAAGSGYYLSFDEAYAPRPGFGPDSLIIETSTNGGTSYSVFNRLWGGNNGGGLNTANATSSQFVPTSSQWQLINLPLTSGTNKIRLKTVSGNGNNLYLDNICVTPYIVTPRTGTIYVAQQGFYRHSFDNLDMKNEDNELVLPKLSMSDTVRVYLHRVDNPSIIVDSAKALLDSATFKASVLFENAETGIYYVVVKHRNCIQTWSKAGGELYTRGDEFSYNFMISDFQAFGGNEILVDTSPLLYAIYSGDVNQDGVVDGADGALIDNDAFNFMTGYVVTDLTGDDVVDASDAAIADNNAFNFVSVMRP